MHPEPFTPPPRPLFIYHRELHPLHPYPSPPLSAFLSSTPSPHFFVFDIYNTNSRLATPADHRLAFRKIPPRESWPVFAAHPDVPVRNAPERKFHVPKREASLLFLPSPSNSPFLLSRRLEPPLTFLGTQRRFVRPFRVPPPPFVCHFP